MSVQLHLSPNLQHDTEAGKGSRGPCVTRSTAGIETEMTAQLYLEFSRVSCPIMLLRHSFSSQVLSDSDNHHDDSSSNIENAFKGILNFILMFYPTHSTMRHTPAPSHISISYLAQPIYKAPSSLSLAIMPSTFSTLPPPCLCAGSVTLRVFSLFSALTP